jgi:hypothetical protein
VAGVAVDARALAAPLALEDARGAMHQLARRRREAAAALHQALVTVAERERAYRRQRAVAAVENADAPNASIRDALTDEAAADARYQRDLALAAVRAHEESLRQVDAERASLHKLVEWSIALARQGVLGAEEQ